MDHDWQWSEGGEGDADTADLQGHEQLGFDDHLGGYEQHDLGGDDLGGHDFGDADSHLGHDHNAGIEEPLGTEHATENYDESVADHAEHTGLTDDHTDHTPPDVPQDHTPDVPLEPHEALVGADPDLDHTADDAAWHGADDPFPPDLHLAAPEPVDGFPWSDPSSLGDADGHDSDDYLRMLDGGHDTGGSATAAADLAQYEGIDVPAGSDAWSTLIGSEDPATSTLARWWAPGS
jgi:hypothetical protein